jgi:hypothetical protein
VVAVVGDSIGRSLDIGLVEQARKEGWTYLTASAGGCRVTHLLTSNEGNATDYERCFETTERLHLQLIARWHPDVVIVVANMEMTDFFDADGQLVEAGTSAWRRGEAREMQVVVDRFIRADSKVVLVEATPSVLPRHCLRRSLADQSDCLVPASGDRLASAFNDLLAAIAAPSPEAVFVVSLTPHLCPAGMCAPIVDEVFARYDGDHYSMAGSRWIVPLLIADMRRIGALPQ